MKKTISLALCLIVASLTWAYDFSYTYSGKTLYYNIVSSTNHTAEVTSPGQYGSWSGYTEPTGYLSIPNGVYYGGDYYSVVTIGEYAFENCSGLTSVTIPHSVTSIDFRAFWCCSSLTSITIPNSVTSIGSYAFFYCSSLTSITIPNSVTSIGQSAFQGCIGLTSITIPNSVTSISSDAFVCCSGLTSVSVNSGNSVYDSRNNCNAIIKTATNELVVGCKNTIIPNSVTSIGSNAFDGSSGLTSIIIPSSVTSIGYGPFDFCSNLNYIYVSTENPVYDSRNNCNAIIKTATNELVVGCKNTVIPNSVTSIGPYAFQCCSGLTSIAIPGSVTSIGECAFNSCSGLSTITIPNAVTSIERLAFMDCSGLTTITIPGSVNLIEAYAFIRCDSLTSIILCDGIDSISRSAFESCDNISTVYCCSNTPPVLYGYGAITSFGECNHTINNLIVHCGYDSNYSVWSSYFSQINCAPFYTLTVQANNAAYGSVYDGGSYPQNSTVTLTAYANNDYHFVRWIDSNTSNPRNVTVTSDMTYTAVFASNNCTITVNSNNIDWGMVSGGGNYQYGQTTTITATPANHYHFERWSDGDTSNPRSIAVIEDMTLTAYFEIDSHNVAVNTNNPDWCTVTGTGIYDYGSVATISVSQTNSHYHFDGWEDGSTLPSRIITVLCDTTLYAYFSSDQYTVSATSADSSMGFVTGDGSYDYGSSATITAHPLTGFKFLHWNDGNTNANRTFTVTQDCEFVAYFGPLQGIDEVQDSEQIIHVFPNPANNVVTLQLQGMTGNAQLTVTDMLGREVMHKQLQDGNFSFSVAGWSPDIYLLKITFGDGSSAVRKLTVTH